MIGSYFPSLILLSSFSRFIEVFHSGIGSKSRRIVSPNLIGPCCAGNEE